MTKRVDLSISITLPDGHSAEKVSITPDGKVRVLDKTGVGITPEYIKRGVHYEREKGKKYQTRINAAESHLSVGGLEELAELESLIVIDTNNAEIEGVKVSAAFFLRVRLVAEASGYRVFSLDQSGHVYEFHNIPDSENPEMLAILKIANDIQRHENLENKPKIGFVTDSDLGSHTEIATKNQTIYGKYNIPDGFSLIYASSDTGQELINKLMKFCDKQSKKYLGRLKNGTFRKKGLALLKEDQSVHFRYTYYPSLEISKEIIQPVTINSETKYKLEFK